MGQASGDGRVGAGGSETRPHDGAKRRVGRSAVERLVDTHAHLEEIEDLDAAIRDARDSGLAAIVTVGSDFASNRRALELARLHEGFVYPALGLHPWQLSEMEPAEAERVLCQVEDNLDLAVAVGEVGLDYKKHVIDGASKERQQAVLRQLLEVAAKHDKAVNIHSRYAWKDSLALVTEAGVKRAVFHWYTGPLSVLREVLARGYYVSVTPAAEYHSEHRRAVKETPLPQLLLETDSPVEYGRETRYTSSPKDVLRSLKAAAEITGIPEADLAAQTTANAARLFGIAGLA